MRDCGRRNWREAAMPSNVCLMWARGGYRWYRSWRRLRLHERFFIPWKRKWDAGAIPPDLPKAPTRIQWTLPRKAKIRGCCAGRKPFYRDWGCEFSITRFCCIFFEYKRYGCWENICLGSIQKCVSVCLWSPIEGQRENKMISAYYC